ncbi:MAG: flagellar biosynthesis anti-sigma factor FlgM [Chitinispirillaceae bacterium]|nr:flagellar biosynthesis anti-sigma factor FlgM [Chitinispirillaceae bacterium]
MRINTVTQSLSAELRKIEAARKTEKEIKNAKASSPDRSEFSADAQRLSDTKAQSETIAAAIIGQPDIRAEKVAEVKNKIEQGYYDSEEFIDKLASKLLIEFGMKLPQS